jgi:hypothetical protein
VADVGSSPPRWKEQTVFQADESDVNDPRDSRDPSSGGRSPSSPPKGKPDKYVDVDVL